MNRLDRKYLCLTLIAIIALAPTATLVKATNKSSYQYGYKTGKSEFNNCQTDADCFGAQNDCQSPITTSVKKSGYWISAQRYDIVTNKTACMDDYSHGWEHSCELDGKACVSLFRNYGLLPDGSLLQNKKGLLTKFGDPSSYQAGYRYRTNDWNQHTDNKVGGYECPLSQPF